MLKLKSGLTFFLVKGGKRGLTCFAGLVLTYYHTESLECPKLSASVLNADSVSINAATWPVIYQFDQQKCDLTPVTVIEHKYNTGL